MPPLRAITNFQLFLSAADDVLNVRAEPNASSAILGGLEPGAGPVEVIETSQPGSTKWGRIVFQEGNGWVSMKFL